MSSSDAEPAFDIDSQLAQTISNIGGNQTIHYGARSRAPASARLWRCSGCCFPSPASRCSWPSR